MTAIEVGQYDGMIEVNAGEHMQVDGESEPFITWRIPYSTAEPLASVLEAFDEAAGVLREASEPGSYGSNRNAEIVQAIRGALVELENAAVIYRTEGGWYAQVRTCRSCGCTDVAACAPPCSWSEPDLCSRCAA